MIPDSNISRQHCAIIYDNGEHYIQDLNSTNGIEHKQEKVQKEKLKKVMIAFIYVITHSDLLTNSIELINIKAKYYAQKDLSV